MSWTSPLGHVWVTGEIVTAANLNTYVTYNLDDLDRRTSPLSDYKAGPGSTSSASYGDLSDGSGPAVSAVIGSTGKALYSCFANLENDQANGQSYVSVALSGATTVVATSPVADSYAVAFSNPSAGFGIRTGITALFTGLNPGATTFTLKYRTGGVASTLTARDRRIILTPLGS